MIMSRTLVPFLLLTLGLAELTDNRLVAFLGNWQPCPSSAQTDPYTHIMVSFAVTFTSWTPTSTTCSPDCTLQPLSICNNAPNPELVAEWRAAGKKVIVSFGGSSMGGHWLPPGNGCWEQCYGREASVVSQLTAIVGDSYDGVDIDYEYYYENGQGGSSFNKGAEAQKFLKDVTEGLRASLPAGSLVTHAPADADVDQGTAYYDVLTQVASSIDFLMPQYYNSFIRPVIYGIDGSAPGRSSALSHYTTLVNNIGAGDPRKIVFGFCTEVCSATNSNANGTEAAAVMEQLKASYPCNGGAFFWEAGHDMNGEWSAPVKAQIGPQTGCVPAAPTPAPISPTAAPTECGAPLAAWAGCKESPTCCQQGDSCYEQNQWWAQCLPTGSCQTETTWEGVTTTWTCNELGLPADPTAQPTLNPTAQTTSNPTAQPTAQTTSNPTAQPTAQTTSNPTAQPTAQITANPTANPTAEPSAPACSETLGAWAGCKDSPTCCQQGDSCYEQNQWWAQCLPTGSCQTETTWEGVTTTWTCNELGLSADPTAQPTAGPCNTEIALWGNCLASPNCCPEGSRCYEQDQYYAQCLPEGQCQLETTWNGVTASWTCNTLDGRRKTENTADTRQRSGNTGDSVLTYGGIGMGAVLVVGVVGMAAWNHGCTAAGGSENGDGELEVEMEGAQILTSGDAGSDSLQDSHC